MSTRQTSPNGKENKVKSDDIGTGAICKYQLQFPSIAAEYDRLILKVKNVTNAQIYAVQTLGFSSSSYNETVLTAEDEEIKVAYPYSLYLTVVADFSDDLSQFEAVYWFENRDPDVLTEEEKSEGTISILTETEVVIKEQKQEVYETVYFWVLVGGLLLALLLGIFCCIGLLRLKRKNDQISTKIQMLTNEKHDNSPHANNPNNNQPSSSPMIDDAVLYQ